MTNTSAKLLNFRHIPSIIASIPLLEEFTLDQFCYAMNIVGIPPLPEPPLVDLPVPALGYPAPVRSLKKFSFTMGDDSIHRSRNAEVVFALGNRLHGAGYLQGLVSLEIYAAMKPRLWLPMLSTISRTLVHLGVSLSEDYERDAVANVQAAREYRLNVQLNEDADVYPGEHIRAIYDILREFPNLRSLTIELRAYETSSAVARHILAPGNYGSATPLAGAPCISPYFLSELSETLAAPVVPLPVLEHLTLRLCSIVCSLRQCAEPATRLADALLARTRYPRFERMSVDVEEAKLMMFNFGHLGGGDPTVEDKEDTVRSVFRGFADGSVQVDVRVWKGPRGYP
ncbi:hypothetical protein C8Q76DRAFT_183609 [Earliella scabrosa]|nr:hypothetical protein C8Q76DRAFT_183609 [Earliella scabrosa]